LRAWWLLWQVESGVLVHCYNKNVYCWCYSRTRVGKHWTIGSTLKQMVMGGGGDMVSSMFLLSEFVEAWCGMDRNSATSTVSNVLCVKVSYFLWHD
jgi:hypothetical protein